MKKRILVLFLFPSFLIAQKTTILKGIITNKDNKPIVDVSVKYNNIGVVSDENGIYQLRIPLKKEVTLVFSHLSYNTLTIKINAKNRNTIRKSVVLTSNTEVLNAVIIKNREQEVRGQVTFDPLVPITATGANSGVENVLSTVLASVNKSNELSTQYNVRGGNFDENLVYVNGIEVYRPFLIRSGQQEGLSFINSNMIKNIRFSAGGFQAKYGDKLSSVLDITYKKPTEFSIAINASLLGVSATFENQLFNKKLSAITGIRYRDNSLFVNSKQIETNFRPKFTDIQSFLSYEVSEKIKVNFLGNFSLNDYNYQPISRRTRFGTVANPLELIVFYSGQEKDAFLTLFGALSADYMVNEKLNFTGTISAYNTQEEEHFDIAATYNLGEVDTNVGGQNFGEVRFSQGIGSQLNHARNDLDAVINNVQFKGIYKKEGRQIDFGVKYQRENIRDRIREWEVIDSLGFSIRPPHHVGNQQPYTPFESEITPFQSVRTDNQVVINRLSGFVQYNERKVWNDHDIWYNFGIRGQQWSVNSGGNISENQLTISPRFQFAIKPNWGEKDILFRISGGWYSQPPSYRELRDVNGNINIDLKAQKSIHFVAAMESSFKMWGRPFKLTTGIYHKNLSNINSYTIDNVRIRYRADNVTKAYAQGVEFRLNGEFVPGSESWISAGFLRTEENIDNRGYISKPSDQRIKFGILWQDYVPSLPNLKAYLNLVYNSGVPSGAPAYADPYQFQNRLRDYKRADVGISYVFTDAKNPVKEGWLSKFKELSAGLELFNMFDIQNSITNTWVRDVYSKTQYGIPNFMTGRVLNFKLTMKF